LLGVSLSVGGANCHSVRPVIIERIARPVSSSEEVA
jgi:hypothetical protein